MLAKTNLMTALLSATLAAALLGGCAPKNWDAEEDGAYDGFEPLNRDIYKLNKGLDFLIVKPVARTYRFIAPSPLRTAVDNVLNNLLEPRNMANNFFQRQGDATVNSAARFVFNSTIGLGGVFDVADSMGVGESPTDFGQTLRAYGLSDTTYIFLPLLGPSSLADAVGVAVDGEAYPPAYIEHVPTRNEIYGVAAVHTRAKYLDASDLLEGVALDEYSFLRDTYEERRQAETPPRSEVWRF